jgi:hypothetical protein
VYCDGYEFLGVIGIRYVTDVDEIPRLRERIYWDSNEFERLRKLLDNYLIPVKPEAELLLQALDIRDIRIIDKNKYYMEPDFARRLKAERERLAALFPKEKKVYRMRKKWWQFWK